MTLTASEIFTSVRDELLGEAQSSPGLLADLANLERYIAETYSARSFIELLQNADDAQAKRFLVTRHGEWLVCANDGKAFSRQDFYSLCRSASSAKQRGQTIGYRGIGFKSVVGVASSVHLLSGGLRTTFSRSLTQHCLGSQAPAPLVRIPHPLDLDDNDPVQEIVRQLEQSGYTSIFVLGGLDANRVQDEFDQFDSDYLLFLRHITEAVLDGAIQRSYQCNRKNIDTNTREVTISGPDRRSSWRIQRVGQCDIAFSLADNKLVPLIAAAAIAHAFLPTLENTGFGVRINADFSTDPSRTRIIFDDATLACIEDAAQAIADKISEATVAPSTDSNLLACLTPTADLATLALQKRSFRTELISRVKQKLNHLKDKISLAPSWLNSADTQNLAASLNQAILAPSPSQQDLQTNFMRYLGVKALTAESVIKAAETMPISPKGCAEVVSHCVRNIGSGVSLRQLIEKPVWIGADSTSPVRLSTLAEKQTRLGKELMETVNAAGVTNAELSRMLKSAGLKNESITIVLPDTGIETPGIAHTTASEQSTILITKDNVLPQQPFDPLLPNSASQSAISTAASIITSRSLPAWRGTEQYVAMMLGEHGYQVEDRSRQNLGYDLYAEKDEKKHYIEVKLLDYAGQPFIITTNEETVARECGDAYIIALTLRGSNDGVHIQFIHDPARALKFIRQCRQWVWECSEYEFKPINI
ncbi:MAG: DUF3883 domain-containing protein [Rhodocyclaceae bacterium]|nr:DUF3883 domain-containing protein [Rhodocyclaceae bacterium]